MVESSPKAWKTIWEKEKLLIISNFSFSHIVFERLKLKTHKNKGLFGKRSKGSSTRLLNHYQTTNFRLVQTQKICRRQFKT